MEGINGFVRAYHSLLDFCSEFGYSNSETRSALKRFGEPDEVGRGCLRSALENIESIRLRRDFLKDMNNEFGVYGLVMAVSLWDYEDLRDSLVRDGVAEPSEGDIYERFYWRVNNGCVQKTTNQWVRQGKVRSNSRPVLIDL